jgi:predicted nucleic-acid-binding protein
MLAIDTNIVVRYLAQDHPEQSPRARDLIINNAVWLSSTVLLETAWVLRSAYGLTKQGVLDALEAFSGLPQVHLQDPDQIAKAFAWARQGMDFADAMHLAAARSIESFVTFDQQLATAAERAGASPVRVL